MNKLPTTSGGGDAGMAPPLRLEVPYRYASSNNLQQTQRHNASFNISSHVDDVSTNSIARESSEYHYGLCSALDVGIGVPCDVTKAVKVPLHVFASLVEGYNEREHYLVLKILV